MRNDRSRRAPGWWVGLLVSLVALVGGFLRFRGLGWAKGYYFQPDESFHTVDYALRLASSLNPFEVGRFTYGHLPLYLYNLTSRALHVLTGDALWLEKWRVTMIARTYAASASTLTIPLVFLLGWRVSGTRTGLAAALCYALAPLSVQYAHFGVVDTLLVFWVVLATLMAVYACQEGQLAWWLLGGAAVGLAVGTKTSGAVWALLFPVAAYLRIRAGDRADVAVWRLVGAGGAAVAAMFSVSPYYILDWSTFRAIMRMQGAKTVTGQALCTYHWQFLLVRPFLFELRQLAAYAVGLPVAFLGLVGLMLSVRHRKLPVVLAMISPFVYLATVGLWHAKFIRYLLPLVPFTCVLAGRGIDWFLGRSGQVLPWMARTALTLALCCTAVLGASVSNVYRGVDPRVAASAWLRDHVAVGTQILHDPEPLINLPLGYVTDYDVQVLDLYGDSMRSINDAGWYAGALDGSEYVVIVSKRNYAPILELSELYPVAGCYYRELFAGRLGYEEAASFANYPSVGPLVWNTEGAEETFQVFDHPVVRVFQRSNALSQDELRARLERCPTPH